MPDELTSLPTFREFPPGIAEHSPYAIVVDVDALIWVNDQFGFEAGHGVLTLVARTVAEVAGHVAGGSAFRIGGDEFLAVFPDTSVDEALVLARRVIAAVAKLAIPYRRLDQRGRKYVAVNAAVIRLTSHLLRSAFLQPNIAEPYRDWLAQRVFAAKKATGFAGVVVALTAESPRVQPPRLHGGDALIELARQ